MSARIHIHASFSARWSVHGRPIVVRTQKLGSIGSRCMHARTDTPSRHKSGTILANETVHLPGIVGRRRGDPRPRRNCEHCLMRAGPVSNPIVFFAALEIHPQCPTRHGSIRKLCEAECMCKNFVVQGDGMEGVKVRTNLLYLTTKYNF